MKLSFFEIFQLFVLCCAILFAVLVLSDIFWKKTRKLTFERIVIHETGHVLLLLAFNPLPENILLFVAPDNGFLNWSFDYEVEGRPKRTRQLRMLLCLAGYVGERIRFGNEFLNGNLKDLEQWYDLYNIYLLENNIQVNELLFVYTAYRFRKKQEKIVAEFIAVNDEIFHEIYRLLLDKKVLGYKELVTFQESIKFPQSMLED